MGIEDGRGYVVGYRIAEKMGNAKGKLPEKGRRPGAVDACAARALNCLAPTTLRPASRPHWMYTSNSPLLAASEVRRDRIDLPPRDARRIVLGLRRVLSRDDVTVELGRALGSLAGFRGAAPPSLLKS